MPSKHRKPGSSRDILAFRAPLEVRELVKRVAAREERTSSQVIRRVLVAWAKTAEADAQHQGAAP